MKFLHTKTDVRHTVTTGHGNGTPGGTWGISRTPRRQPAGAAQSQKFERIGLARSGRCLLIALLVLICSHGVSFGQRTGEKSWEIPGKLAIHNLELGAAVLKDNEWNFLGDSRMFSAKEFEKRLTLMVRFSYERARTEIPLKFMIRLPDARLYEEQVVLTGNKGEYRYMFTIQHPEDFQGSGSIYLYYGFSFVDALNFTITGSS
ncbi:MAG: hypothetical protein AB1646_02545 [Thermodesulfobacteriota bacterium]